MVKRICHSAAVMRDGRFVESGAITELLHRENSELARGLFPLDAPTTLPGQTTTSTGRSAPTVPLPTVPPGSTVTAPVGCPPADGSAPRITSFSAPPPNCLEPGLHYTARIRTTRGPIIVDLDDVTSPQAVNAFIFLARHHYYDGLPFTNVKRGAFATVADPKGADGKPGPGFAIPSGTGQVGIVTPVTVALTPGENGATGGLIIAMPGDQVTTIPESAPRIGQIRCDFAQPVNPEDPDRTVQQEINDTATSSGGPSAVITIEGVDILNDDRVCR